MQHLLPRTFRGIFPAMTLMFIVVMAGHSRAAGVTNFASIANAPTNSFDAFGSTLFGNTNGNSAGWVQDSNKGGHGGHDTINPHVRDSINRAKHIKDSLDHARQDSLNRIGHTQDSLKHGHDDSVRHGDHVRDSLGRAKQDSLSHHKRDSVGHNGGTHRDSIPKGHRDTVIRTHRDSSIHHLDSVIKVWRDSVIRSWHDTTHHRKLVGPQGGDGEKIGKQASEFVTPDAVDLSQNYPNPFGANASTAIEFILPSDGNVSLAVYNAAGLRMTTIRNEYMTAGQYHVDYDASALAPGVYFYTLSTSQGTMTKRMVKLH